MKTASRVILIVLLSFGLVFPSAQSKISVSSKVSRTTLTIGDPLYYTLIVKHSPDLEVDSLALNKAVGNFEIRKKETTEKKSKKEIVTKYEIVLVPWSAGEFLMPALPVTYRGEKDSLSTIYSEPVKVRVKSILATSTDTTNIRDLKAQLELGRSLWLYLALGGAVLLALALAYYFWRRKPKSQVPAAPPRPAWEMAKEELLALKESSRKEKMEPRLYYFQLSEIIRDYLEKRFGVPLLERTTEEIKAEEKLDFLAPESKSKFLNFLEQSDLIKFAKHKPSSNQEETDWQIAWQLVEETIPRVVTTPAKESVKA